MTYHRSARADLGCACRGCGKGALGGIVDPTQIKAIGAPVGIDPALYLRAQLNRYTVAGGATTAQSPIAPDALPLVPSIDATTAARALFVLGRRAGDAAQTYKDAATTALLATYGAAWGDPIGYVTSNLPAVIDVVRLYADKQGLPAAKGVPSIVGGFELTTERVVLLGGAAIAAYYLFGKRRRRR
jgi:hypothetical protein